MLDCFSFWLVTNVNPCHGQTDFVDDFDGGDAAWSVVGDEGTFNIVDGNYVATGNDANVKELMVAEVNGANFDAVSVQAQAVGRGDLVVFARTNDGAFQGYGASINHVGNATLFRFDAPDTPLIFLDLVSGLSFNATDEVKLRLDAVGSDLSFTVWPFGQEMPTTPTLMATDATYSQGGVGIGFQEAPSSPGSTASFREFRALVIPEPTSMTMLLGGLLACLVSSRRSRYSQV